MTGYEERREAAREQWRVEFPCVCTIEYTGRGLVAPNCDYHDADIADDIVGAFLAAGDTVLERCRHTYPAGCLEECVEEWVVPLQPRETP